jgi:hypothetical protein
MERWRDGEMERNIFSLSLLPSISLTLSITTNAAKSRQALGREEEDTLR